MKGIVLAGGSGTRLYPITKGVSKQLLTQEELEEKFRGLALYGGLTQKECDDVLEEIGKEKFSINKIMNIWQK